MANKELNYLFPILDLKKEGKFYGTISVHTMISNENIHNLYETVCFLDELGIANNNSIFLPNSEIFL